MTHVVTLTRGFQNSEVTLGMMQIKDIDHEPIFTLENPWINNTPHISCIPKDSYVCGPYSGTKYKDVYLVKEVADRSAILIHPGNFETDTEGCILPGLSIGEIKGKIAVLNSRTAMNYLKTLLGKEPFILNIK